MAVWGRPLGLLATAGIDQLGLQKGLHLLIESLGKDETDSATGISLAAARLAVKRFNFARVRRGAVSGRWVGNKNVSKWCVSGSRTSRHP